MRRVSLRNTFIEANRGRTMIEKWILGIGAGIVLYIINSALFVMLIAGALLYGLMRFLGYVNSD